MVSTPDSRKQRQLCHVNMLKSYHSRDDSSASESVAQVAMVITQPYQMLGIVYSVTMESDLAILILLPILSPSWLISVTHRLPK